MDPYEKPPPYSPPDHCVSAESTVTYPPGSASPYIPPPPNFAPYNSPPVYAATAPPNYATISTQPGMPTYGSVTTFPVSTTIIVGGCPVCRRGILQESYPCCAICLAIVCFPIGICCCLAMKQKECGACGATFQ